MCYFYTLSRQGAPHALSLVGVQSNTLLYPLHPSLVEGPLVCTLWCLCVSAGSSWIWGCATEPCQWAVEPGWSSCLLSACQANIDSGVQQVLWSRIIPSAPESSRGSSTISMWFLLYSSCSVGSKLFLRRNCSKYRCTSGVFWVEGELSIHLCHHFNPPLY